MDIHHSSASNEHYTPSHLVEAARKTMGGIDLDPASCPEANGLIRAQTLFTREQDGFKREWFGRVFLNPPGGKIAGKSQQKEWWFKLAKEYATGRIEQAIFIGFSVEILQTTQCRPVIGLRRPAECSLCFPSRRIAYNTPGGATGKSPPHSSVIVYLGDNQREFESAFDPIGITRLQKEYK